MTWASPEEINGARIMRMFGIGPKRIAKLFGRSDYWAKYQTNGKIRAAKLEYEAVSRAKWQVKRVMSDAKQREKLRRIAREEAASTGRPVAEVYAQFGVAK